MFISKQKLNSLITLYRLVIQYIFMDYDFLDNPFDNEELTSWTAHVLT